MVLDVVVAWGLFGFFEQARPGLTRLVAWLRVSYAAVLAVAVSRLSGVLDLVGGGDHLDAFTTDQHQTAALLDIASYHHIWEVGLVIFGCHLVVVGRLCLVSPEVPRVIGLFVVLAGLGYVADSLGSMLVADSPWSVSVVTFIGEVLLMVWLLARVGA